MIQLLRAIDGDRTWESVKDALTDSERAGVTAEVLRSKANRRTLRLRNNDGSSVIVKTWSRHKRSPFLYRMAYRWTTAYREYRMPQLLAAHGIDTARSLSYFSFIQSDGTFGEAVVLEDLGRVTLPIDMLKGCLIGGDDKGIWNTSHALIALTSQFVSNGFLDHDHRLQNFAITPSHRLVRLDLEHCRRVSRKLLRMRSTRYTGMLSSLLGSYAFAVQPRIELVEQFADELVTVLKPPQGVLERVKRDVTSLLQRQEARKGIEMTLALPW